MRFCACAHAYASASMTRLHRQGTHAYVQEWTRSAKLPHAKTCMHMRTSARTRARVKIANEHTASSTRSPCAPGTHTLRHSRPVRAHGAELGARCRGVLALRRGGHGQLRLEHAPGHCRHATALVRDRAREGGAGPAAPQARSCGGAARGDKAADGPGQRPLGARGPGEHHACCTADSFCSPRLAPRSMLRTATRCLGGFLRFPLALWRGRPPVYINPSGSFHPAEINFPPGKLERAVVARARTQRLCFKARAPGTLVGAQPPPPPAHLLRAVSAPRTDLVRHARYGRRLGPPRKLISARDGTIRTGRYFVRNRDAEQTLHGVTAGAAAAAGLAAERSPGAAGRAPSASERAPEAPVPRRSGVGQARKRAGDAHAANSR